MSESERRDREPEWNLEDAPQYEQFEDRDLLWILECGNPHGWMTCANPVDVEP